MFYLSSMFVRLFHLCLEMHAMAKWQKWRKIASLWRFELDAKRGPLETGDFGKISGFGENRHRAGDNGDKRPDP